MMNKWRNIKTGQVYIKIKNVTDVSKNGYVTMIVYHSIEDDKTWYVRDASEFLLKFEPIKD